jgi:hypothetical protein
MSRTECIAVAVERGCTSRQMLILVVGSALMSRVRSES